MKSKLFKGLPSGEVIFLEDEIFGKHQVISQQLVKQENSLLYFFFFDKGEGISKEIHSAEMLYIIKKGQVTFNIEGREVGLNSNSAIKILSNKFYSLEVKEQTWLFQIVLEEIGGNMDYIKNIDKEEIKHLEDMVEYQEDRITSLSLVQRESFTVTILAMTKGNGVGPHASNGDAMVVALDGEADICIGENHYTVKKGETIVMPADIMHLVNAKNDNFKMLLIVSKPE